MNDSEFEQNCWYACMKYAIDNGGIENYLDFPYQCVLFNNGHGIFIHKWTHPSIKPTFDDLKKYSMTDLNNSQKIWDSLIRLKENKIPVCSKSIGEIMKPYTEEGQLMYCTTDSVLKIYLNNSWKSL